MEKDIIKDKVLKLFQNRLNKDFSGKEELLDVPLFGLEIGIHAFELVYIFFDIEREFNIHISEKDIQEGKLSTINTMINMIDSYKL